MEERIMSVSKIKVDNLEKPEDIFDKVINLDNDSTCVVEDLFPSDYYSIHKQESVKKIWVGSPYWEESEIIEFSPDSQVYVISGHGDFTDDTRIGILEFKPSESILYIINDEPVGYVVSEIDEDDEVREIIRYLNKLGLDYLNFDVLVCVN